MKRILLTGLMCSAIFFALQAQTIRYVKQNGTGNGSSWANASGDLQAMINASGNSNEVWVAAGTYKCTTGTDRTISFSMKDGVAIYGGFYGNEIQLNQRNITSNETILSGDLLGNDAISGAGVSLSISNNDDNSYNVIANRFTSSNPLSSTAVLDGFTITGGNSEVNLVGAYNAGAGMFNNSASPTLRNLIFVGNKGFRGGGMMNSLNCSPTLTDVTFTKNFSQKDGGAIYNFDGANTVLNNVVFSYNMSYGDFGGGAVFNGNNNPTFTNCRFIENFATVGGAVVCIGATASFAGCHFINNGTFQSAGVMWAEASNITFNNSVFSGNKAGLYGGVIHNRSSSVSINNSTIVNNLSGNFANSAPYVYSGVMAIDGNDPVTITTNSIIWGNRNVFDNNSPVISNSIVQGGYSGSGITSADPQLKDINNPVGADQVAGTADDGLMPLSKSPGLNASGAGATANDILGNAAYGIRDVGAYEYQGPPCYAIITNLSISACDKYLWVYYINNNRFEETISTSGTYTKGLTSVNGCDSTVNLNLTITKSTSPTTILPNTWYVYAYAYGNGTLGGTDWNTNYTGYYTAPSLNFNTENDWTYLGSPSDAANYQGCKVQVDNMSYTAKRQGFDCGFYAVNVQFHDDAAQLFVNGSKVWEHDGCCDDHGTVWSGWLGANDSIEYRVSEAGGGSAARLFFNLITDSIVYVDNSKVTGANNGSSWANAYTNLQDALSTANAINCIKQIWVASGTYKPTRDPFGNSNPDDPRDKTFFIGDGLKIYGGFAGTETSLNQRITGANLTILSGDIDNNNVLDNGNAYHVLLAVAPTSNAKGIVLDGFTVTGGNATGNSFITVNFTTVVRSISGGILLIRGANTISNNTISANASSSRAGAIWASLGTQAITNNYFSNNRAPEGGAIYFLAGSNTTLAGNRFAANTSFNGGGGAVTIDGGTYSFTNNVFSGNTALGDGGGVYLLSATATFTNSSFSGNTANRGGAVFNSSGTQSHVNSIVWGNGSNVANRGGIANNGGTNNVTYSIVQGGFSGTGNLNIDPLFVQQPAIGLGTTGNLRLRACSPAVNAGSNAALPPAVNTDADGRPRIFNSSTVDMGAFELQREPLGVTNITATACSQYTWVYFINNERREDIITQTGNYSKILVGSDGCDSTLNLNLTITTPAGNPSVFGDNTWNVYGFNSGNGTLAGTDWSTNYRGYYTINNLNINTGSDWDELKSLSTASTYQGCSIEDDNHSYSAKRQGFPCGFYSLDIPLHDDAAQLFINGTKVWEHDDCCDSHIGVWSGWLGADDRVEYRISEGTGNSVALLTFNLSTTSSMWTGAIDNLWSKAGNWSCNNAPLPASDIIINSGAPQLDIDFTVAGTLALSGTASFTINPNKILTISGAANFGNRPVVVTSDATGTGSIGQLAANGNNLTGATNVTVERYLAPNITGGRTGRAWRLLTSPVTGPSINAAWQEGRTFNGTNHVLTGTSTIAEPIVGYGTNLNGAAQSTAVNANGNGLDFWSGVANSSSAIRRYIIGAAGGTWANSIQSTLSTIIQAYPAYLTYIRGDRSLTTGTSSNATTLRAKGSLRQGRVTVTPSGFAYTLVGNPYPSAIDFEKIYAAASAAIQPRFWLWDANLNLVGGYRLIEREGANNYSSTPFNSTGTGSYQNIESGAGFFVEPSATPAAFNIEENHKTSGTPTVTVFRETALDQKLYINLNLVSNAGVLLADGVQARFSSDYQQAVTGEDIGKPNNMNETLSLARGTSNLMVEKRPFVTDSDTLFLHLANTTSWAYQFVMHAQQIDDKGLTAMLEDLYTKTTAAIDLAGETIISFEIDSDAASKAQNRFRIVLQSAKILPATFTGIKAYQQGTAIAVNWQVANEVGIKSYQIERSATGQRFNGIGNAVAQNRLSATYQHLDGQPLSGSNYYRIKQVSAGGDVRYSSVVKVSIGKGSPSFSVYPNPLTGSQFSIQLNHLPAGTYQLQIINSAGQQVYRTTVAHIGGSAAQAIQCHELLSKGMYQVQLTGADTNRYTTQLITQ